jgi:AcrR family transcriptional regulator
MVARSRVTVAARAALGATGELTDVLVADICEQSGIHPFAFRTLFPSNDDLLDAVNARLVEECADRLRSGVATFTPPEDPGSTLSDAAVALAKAKPLDRGGFLIRARWRLTAIQQQRDAATVAQAERRFVSALTGIFGELFEKLGRRFHWPPKLAVRVILDTYERSFEAWILAGNSEHDFSESPYVRRTLPRLLEKTSELIP